MGKDEGDTGEAEEGREKSRKRGERDGMVERERRRGAGIMIISKCRRLCSCVLVLQHTPYSRSLCDFLVWRQ